METEVKYILELIRDKTITVDNGTERILNLFGVDKSVCPKCGSNKLYTSTTGKICCVKCALN